MSGLSGRWSYLDSAIADMINRLTRLHFMSKASMYLEDEVPGSHQSSTSAHYCSALQARTSMYSTYSVSPGMTLFHCTSNPSLQ